jgi:hypothetical protein
MANAECQMPNAKRGQAFIVGFGIRHLPFAICHLPFGICHLPFAIDLMGEQ